MPGNISRGYLACCFGRLPAAGSPEWLKGEVEKEFPDWLRRLRLNRAALDTTAATFGAPDANGHRLCRLQSVPSARNTAFVSIRPLACLKNGRVSALRKALGVLAQLGRLPPQGVDLLMTMRDIEVNSYPVPVFADMRPVALAGHILRFPMEFLMTFWARLMAPRIRNAVLSYPWHEKRPRLFWRGGLTSRWLCRSPDSNTECLLLDDPYGNHRWNLTNWDLSARGRAVQLSSLAPQWIDARFSSAVGMSQEVADMLRSRGWLEEGQPPLFEKQFENKYLLVTDDSDRIFWMATGNSLLFLPQSDILRGCGLSALRPFTHYVPLRADLADAIDRVAWAREHDDEARRIAARGAAFARMAFSHEAQLLCLQRIVEAYTMLLV